MIFHSGCDIAGDGFCDDAVNDGECGFDGGDCCLPDIIDDYCSYCICYANQTLSMFCTVWKFKNFPFLKKLHLNSYVLACNPNEMWLLGDGYCQDSSNSEQCDFDGGDCCLNQIIAACYDCICYEDGTRHPEEKGINKHPVLSIAKL